MILFPQICTILSAILNVIPFILLIIINCVLYRNIIKRRKTARPTGVVRLTHKNYKTKENIKNLQAIVK